MKIIVLKGCPASGKSFWAREFIKKNKDYVIVSRDSIRESRGEYWIPEQEDYISDIEVYQIKSALNHNLNVIIDATNLNPKTIKKWEELAEETNSELEFKEFKIDFHTALQRDIERGKNGGRAVGKKVLKQFFDKYYPELYKDNRIILKPDTKLPKCVIVDLDGSICLNNGRSFLDYDKVKTDICDPRMKLLLESFTDDIDVIFLSGREDIGRCRQETTAWLENNLPYDITDDKLLLRRKNDHRKDSIVKKELYEKYIKNKYNIICVFEDRNQCVDMWRDLGILCCQVYYGEF